MWASEKWRELSTGAQWLYMHLLTSPTLNYVGVADWRPARIAAKVRDVSIQDVLDRAAELEAGRFVFCDSATEEIVIRSFLKHDGLLLNPNLWRSVGNDFADVSSIRLMGVISREARRLREAHPDGFQTSKGGVVNPWVSKYLATMLDTPSADEETPSGGTSQQDHATPPATPPLFGVGRGCPTATTTATATSSKEEIDTPKANPKRKGIYSQGFLEFWEMGLRKESKGAAWRAWEKARKAGTLPDLESLRTAVQMYIRHHPDPSFQKHPATWLNAAAWEDDYSPAPQTERAKERLR